MTPVLFPLAAETANHSKTRKKLDKDFNMMWDFVLSDLSS